MLIKQSSVFAAGLDARIMDKDHDTSHGRSYRHYKHSKLLT